MDSDLTETLVAETWYLMLTYVAQSTLPHCFGCISTHSPRCGIHVTTACKMSMHWISLLESVYRPLLSFSFRVFSPNAPHHIYLPLIQGITSCWEASFTHCNTNTIPDSCSSEMLPLSLTLFYQYFSRKHNPPNSCDYPDELHPLLKCYMVFDHMVLLSKNSSAEFLFCPSISHYLAFYPKECWQSVWTHVNVISLLHLNLVQLAKRWSTNLGFAPRWFQFTIPHPHLHPAPNRWNSESIEIMLK